MFVKVRTVINFGSWERPGLKLVFVKINPNKVILDHKKSYLVNFKQKLAESEKSKKLKY